MKRFGGRFGSLGAALLLAVSGGLGQTARADDDGWEADVAKIHTADCDPVDAGKFESFIGFESSRAKKVWDIEGDEGDRGGAIKDGHFLVGLTYGIAKDLDLGISTGYDNCTDDLSPVCTKGLDDVAVASKWKVVSKGVFGLAFLPSFVLPVGTQDNMTHLGTTQKFYSAGLGVVAVQAYHRVTFNLDAGFSVPFGGDRGDDRDLVNLDTAIGVQPLRFLQPEVELNYSAESEKDADASKSLALTAGLLIPTEKMGRFQLALQPTLWGRSADRATSFHLSWVMGFPK